ncbi:hypothetical protein VI817_001059 [Penicillium citrinum]|nr:hypothetical protein VI817_001059 [Penicillium citrinum]
MSEIDFFPGPLYKKNTIISFPLAQHGYNQWIIETKLSHSNHQRDEAQAKAGRATSYAVGTFRVYNHERCIHAYLRTYLQVPYIGTEFASVEDRAVQATQIRHTEITAVQDLHRRSSRITPALFAIKEGIQTDQDSVPSGYVTHFVFEEVAGIRLAEDDLLPEKGKTHTFFQKFTRSQRDKIRAKFDESYRSLKFMGWWPDFPWATNLVWNDETSTLSVFFLLSYSPKSRLIIAADISSTFETQSSRIAEIENLILIAGAGKGNCCSNIMSGERMGLRSPLQILFWRMILENGFFSLLITCSLCDLAL